MSVDDEVKNYVEARVIVQEVHDGSSVFIVGSAPFGRIWFDTEKVQKQYQLLVDNWNEEYGDNDTEHSKKPRVVKILIEEDDSMFHTTPTDKDEKLDAEKEEKKKEVIPDEKQVDEPSNVTPASTTEVKPKRKYTKRKKTEETEKKALDTDQNADETKAPTKKPRAKKSTKVKETTETKASS